MERKQLKPKREPAVSPEAIKSALFKKQLTDKIDRELGDKYWDLACKDKTDISHELLLTCESLSLKKNCPDWGCEEIAKVIQDTMWFVDFFRENYEGDLPGFKKYAYEVTDLDIKVDSKPKEEEE